MTLSCTFLKVGNFCWKNYQIFFIKDNGNGEYELKSIKVEEIASKQNDSNKPNGCRDGIANEDKNEATVPLKWVELILSRSYSIFT